MNKKKLASAVLLSLIASTSANFVSADNINTVNMVKLTKSANNANTVNMAKLTNIANPKNAIKLEFANKNMLNTTNIKAFDIKAINNIADLDDKNFNENNIQFDFEEYKPSIEDIKNYLPEEIKHYKKIAKNNDITKKLDEIAKKLSKTTKVEDAQKLEDEFYKLLEDEKNFDFEKQELISMQEEFAELEKELKNYKKSDKNTLKNNLKKLKSQHKEILEMQKKIDAFYNDLSEVQNKIYPDMPNINIISGGTGDIYEDGTFKVTDNKKAIEVAKTLKKDNVTTTLDKYFDKNSIKNKTDKIKFIEEVMTYYAAMSNWEAHETYLALEKYLENLEK